MSALYTLTCDGCGKRSPPYGNSTWDDERASVRREIGWTHPARGQDFCRECSERRAERAKKENPNGYL